LVAGLRLLLLLRRLFLVRVAVVCQAHIPVSQANTLVDNLSVLCLGEKLGCFNAMWRVAAAASAPSWSRYSVRTGWLYMAEALGILLDWPTTSHTIDSPCEKLSDLDIIHRDIGVGDARCRR
jgi:hypothetical protein